MTINLTIASLLLALFITNVTASNAEEAQHIMPDTTSNKPYSCTFSDGEWNIADWMFARRSDMQSLDEWTQEKDHIENKSAASHSFTSMVYREKWQGHFTATATMEFTDRMAPSIVLAWKFGEDAQGRQEYLEHMEIVLFDQGINIWLHRTVDNKPVWVKTAYTRFPLEKNTKYQLQLIRKGQDLSVAVRDHIFGYREEALPKEMYVGVTAAEGINRLYNFQIR